jgi:hypothetical protein
VIATSNIPGSLRALNHWCVWRYDERDGKLTKTPSARSNDRTTWLPFETCLHAVEASQGILAGLGFMLLDPYVALDIDHCVDDDGAIELWARQIIDEISSYAEISPSGRGVRIIATGSISAAAKRNGVEIYQPRLVNGAVKGGRYVTVTGNHIAGTPTEVAPCEHLESLRKRINGDQVRPYLHSSTTTSLRLVSNSGCGSDIPLKQSADFEALWRGDEAYVRSRYGADNSAADLGMMNLLAIKTDGDRDSMESLFTESARGARDKWRDREDYRRRTIDKSLQWYSNWKRPGEPDSSDSAAPVDPDAWRELFHSYDDFINEPPLKFAIRGFLQEDGITYLGGLPGHGKTLVMLSIVKSLLEGTPLFGHPDFVVETPPKRVLYLTPEAGIRGFKRRLELFGLLPHVRDQRFFVRTLSSPESVTLSDPRILRVAEGADVFLDTAIRFMEGDENSAADHKAFAATLFALQRAGARTIVGAHHSPKAFGENNVITLESTLRGSGDSGAMVATCWALKQLDASSTTIYVKNVKARDFDACLPFEIAGRPHIDATGNFVVSKAPGNAQAPQRKRKEDPRKAVVLAMCAEGRPAKDIAEELGVSKRTVYRWKWEHLSGPAGNQLGAAPGIVPSDEAA